jgi:hypothetical protein
MYNDTATSYKWVNTTTDATPFYVTGAGSVLCYQESANVSTSCGGLSTGAYYIPNNEDSAWLSPANLIDGDWNTYGYTGGINGGYSTFYVNYTKPAGALNSSLWQVKDNYGMVNLTIPQGCWDFNSTTLLLKVRSTTTLAGTGFSEWSCYNSTWQVLRQTPNGYNQIYEEAMYWNITGVQNPQSIGSIYDGQSYLLNYTVNVTDSLTRDYKLIFNFTSSLAPNPAENDTQPAYIRITTIADTQPPTYSLNSTNSTLAGTAVSHNLYWQDNIGLSYAIFSFDNCTGSLQNITGMSLSGTSAWSNFTVVINSTIGCTIRWCVYANDTSNNWNGTSCLQPFSYVTNLIPDINITLNVSKVWWEDGVLASGTLYTDSGKGLPDRIVNVKLDGITKCSSTTNSNGHYSCNFTAPNELGTFIVNATSGSSSASTILQVMPNYGQKAIGTADRIVYEVPILIQDLNGKIRQAWVRIMTWKG